MRKDALIITASFFGLIAVIFFLMTMGIRATRTEAAANPVPLQIKYRPGNGGAREVAADYKTKRAEMVNAIAAGGVLPVDDMEAYVKLLNQENTVQRLNAPLNADYYKNINKTIKDRNLQ